MTKVTFGGNRGAFLDMIAYSEGTSLMGDNGYNVIVGSTPKKPNLFTDYSKHPNILIYIKNLKVSSTAAGRYQLLHRYYEPYRKMLHLNDFSPYAQDCIALQQIKECHALKNVDEGRFNLAVVQCKNIWASLPSAPYGQPQRKIGDLRKVYVASGGTFSDENKEE